MRYRLFQYPLPAAGELGDLNAYLASQRVAQVSHQIVTAPAGPMLVFLVQTVEAAPAPTARSDARVDYRALLDDGEFAVFSQLRDTRKKIAEEEGVPVYTIFTNAQLADMVRRGVRGLADLGEISGIGQARIEKYGRRMLATLGHHA